MGQLMMIISIFCNRERKRQETMIWGEWDFPRQMMMWCETQQKARERERQRERRRECHENLSFSWWGSSLNHYRHYHHHHYYICCYCMKIFYTSWGCKKFSLSLSLHSWENKKLFCRRELKEVRNEIKWKWLDDSESKGEEDKKWKEREKILWDSSSQVIMIMHVDDDGDDHPKGKKRRSEKERIRRRKKREGKNCLKHPTITSEKRMKSVCIIFIQIVMMH